MWFTLAMMITGIVMGKKAQLGPMSTEVPHPIKDKSIERRMQRWVKNERIPFERYFMPFAIELLAGLAHTTLVLAMEPIFRTFQKANNGSIAGCLPPPRA